MSGHGPQPPSYRARLLANVQPYLPSAQAEVLAFRAAMYGPESVYCDPAALEWLYEEPARDGEPAASLSLYRQHGEVVGHQGALRVPLKIGGRTHAAAWGVHLMVDPRYRLRGVGAALAQHTLEQKRLLLGVEVSEEARPALRRAGWAEVAGVPLFLRVLDAAWLARQRLPGAWVERPAELANYALRHVDALLGAALRVSSTRLEVVAKADERLDHLWDQASPHYEVLGRRDRAFVDWRYGAYPDPERYQLLYCFRRGELIGYAVMRFEALPTATLAHIVDWFCRPASALAVLASCVDFARQAGAALVHCLHLGAAGHRALRWLGFIERKSAWPLMFAALDLEPQERARLRRPSAWFLTGGDSDVDRPRTGTVYATGSPWERPGAPRLSLVRND